jgi:hypothetical protein
MEVGGGGDVAGLAPDAADGHDSLHQRRHLRVAVQGAGEGRRRAKEENGDLFWVVSDEIAQELVGGMRVM